jgi:S-DNA-T family DNA segregation ATPase FtsK/SpoIIIE
MLTAAGDGHPPARCPASPHRAAAGRLRNKAGLAGAWVADLPVLHRLGHSAGGCPRAARSWLSALARQLRGPAWRRMATAGVLGGPPAALCASCGWNGRGCTAGRRPCRVTRAAYWATLWGRFDARWLGFAGSGVAWIALLVAGDGAGAALFLDRPGRCIGARIDTFRQRRQSARKSPRTVRIGEQALREREHVASCGARGDRGHIAGRDREADAGRAPLRARGQGAPEAAVQGTDRHQAAAGRPARRAPGRGRRR